MSLLNRKENTLKLHLKSNMLLGLATAKFSLENYKKHVKAKKSNIELFEISQNPQNKGEYKENISGSETRPKQEKKIAIRWQIQKALCDQQHIIIPKNAETLRLMYGPINKNSKISLEKPFIKEYFSNILKFEKEIKKY